MKALCLPFLLAAFVAAPCVACGGATSGDATAGDNALVTTYEFPAKPVHFTCTEDTPRVGAGETQSIVSFELELLGQNATITHAAFSSDLMTQLTGDKADDEKQLSSGRDLAGKPLTSDAHARITKDLSTINTLIDLGGPKKAFEMSGKNRPYVRNPKVPTVQYDLSVQSPGVDQDEFWGYVGNEGYGGRLLLKPEMLKGTAAKPDIEWEGSQGPLWDRFDCK